MRLLAMLTVSSLPFVIGFASGQDKKDKKDEPRVTMTIPLGAAPGTTSKLIVRGLKLDKAKTVRFENEKVVVKLLKGGPAGVPDKNPDKVGDPQIEVEVTLPKDLPSGKLPFVVQTPSGEAKHYLLVDTLPLVKEKEPNDGFKQAQPIILPCVVDGLIERQRDVDVFRFEGKAGERVVFEVLAARHGSGLDSVLTLYDAAGQQIAGNDDQKDTTDSRIEITLPADGAYYLSLVDAHDQGGPEHPYRLTGRVVEKR